MVFAVGVLTKRLGMPEQNAGHTNARLNFVSTREFTFVVLPLQRADFQPQSEQMRVCYLMFLIAGARVFRDASRPLFAP